ncbi:MAG: glucokinase [Steroidobacteraceae bacterium]
MPRLAQFFAQSEFRSRFEAKGRMRGCLAAIRPELPAMRRCCRSAEDLLA